MGTIAEKGAYTIETKSLLKDKINNLGGSIDNNTTFRQYANQLQTIYDNLPKTEYQEGTEVNLGVTSKGKLDYENGVVGIGQSSQDGEPTPSTPIAINSVTGNQDVVVSGINKLSSANAETKTNSDYSVTCNGEGTYTINSIPTSTYREVAFTLKDNYTIKSGDYLQVNADFAEYRANIQLKDTSNNQIVLKTYTQSQAIVDLSEHEGKTIKYIAIGCSNTAEHKGTLKPLICNSSTQVPFEPYITPTAYQLSLGDKELFGDSFIDRDSNGDWYFNDNYLKELFKNGSISRKTTNTTGVYRFSIEFTNPAKPIDNSDVADIKSNIFEAITVNNTYSKVQGVAINNAGAIYFYGDDFKSYTQAEMTTYFSTKNDYIVYPLNTPIRTKITDETLISQLNAWYNAHSNNGTTIITSNGNLPMIIKCRALKGE